MPRRLATDMEGIIGEILGTVSFKSGQEWNVEYTMRDAKGKSQLFSNQ